MVTASFGEVDGRRAHSFVIESDGLRARLTDYGARLVELWVPDRDGRAADIVLGFDTSEEYAANPSLYFGATVGRYGNRISRGRFTLRGNDYELDCNEGRNHLHGGHDGWDQRLWATEPDGASIAFRTSSADGDMGYPGTCEVTSTYELDGSVLRITMEAVAAETTVVNMVHHSYFNLAGHASGDVLQQHLRLPSEFYVPVDDELLPTGEIRAVAGTAFDFRRPRPIGAEGGQYDHNWCLQNDGSTIYEAADVVDLESGRRLVLRSTEPGVQVYTGGYLSDTVVGKGGQPYCRNAGLTLETQKFPDSPNHAHFPTAVVEAGQAYRHVMEFDFSTD